MADPGLAIRRAPVLGSAIVRQTFVLLAVFLIVDVVSLGATYAKLRLDLRSELQEVLNDEIASFELSATPRALAAIVSARARVSAPEDRIVVFLRADGGQVGNARAIMESREIRVLPLDGGEPLAPAGYLRDTRQLDGGVLLVGVSLGPLGELADTFLVLLALSLVPTAAVSVVTAALLSRQNARRVARIEGTLRRLSAGDLAARVDPVTGSDDLALLAAGVNRMAERQQASTEALRQVTTDIAHDLKTPLQRLSVQLADLDAHIEDDAEAAQLLANARDEAGRAVAIFDSMLRIAQIEGGTLGQSFAPVDLCDVVRAIYDLHQPSLEDAGLHPSLKLPPGPLVVKGDADLLAQALSNLLENAKRHTPRGTEIVVSAQRSGSDVVLTVADKGPGIPDSERGRVTRRFYRLERSRSTPGHGLGLALVSAIAEVHHGTLTLDDNRPGLRVSLRIPAVDARRDNWPVETAEESA